MRMIFGRALGVILLLAICPISYLRSDWRAAVASPATEPELAYIVILTLISVDTGRSARIFTSAPTGDCDACRGASYEITWNSTSTVFAMLTPYVWGGAREVMPSVRVYRLKNGRSWQPLSRVIPLHRPYPIVLGWAHGSRELILYSDRSLYRYVPDRRRLIQIVRGLPYSQLDLISGYGRAASLRPSA